MSFDIPQEVGGIRVLSRQDREKYYHEHPCAQACSDAMAKTIDRVKWLMHERLRLRFKTFLALGCPDGGMERWLVDEFGFEKLVGTDISFDAIQVARQMIQHRLHPEKAEYRCCSYIEFTEGEGTWEACSTFELYEHLPPDEAKEMLAYMNRMLCPGGTGFICTPNKAGCWGESNLDVHHLNLQTVEELSKTVEEVVGAKPHIVNYKPTCPHLMAMWTKPKE